MVRYKTRNYNKTTPPTLLFLQGSASSFQFLYQAPSEQCMWMGSRGYGWYLTVPPCLLLPPHTLPLLQCGSPWSFRKKSAPVWALHGLNFLQEVSSCSSVHSSPSVLSIHSHSFFSDLGVCTVFSFLSPHFSASSALLPFLKYLSTEAPCTQLCPVMGPLEPGGTHCVWHGAAPDPFSQMPPLEPHATKTSSQTYST